MPHKLAWAVAAGGIAFLGIAVVAMQAQPASPPPPAPQPGPTPGPSCVPIQLSASGPGTVSGCGGQARNSATPLCPQPGEQCVYSAWPDPGAQFLHWAGPNGVTASQNPITLPSSSPGFVVGYFGPGSGPGGPPPPPLPSPPPGLPSCSRTPGAIVSTGESGARVYVVDGQGRKDWIPNGFVQAGCLFGGPTTCNVDAIPDGPDVVWPQCAGIPFLGITP